MKQIFSVDLTSILGIKATCVGIVVYGCSFFIAKDINIGNEKRKKESPNGKMEDILQGEYFKVR